MSAEDYLSVQIDRKSGSRLLRSLEVGADRAVAELAGCQHGLVARRQLLGLGLGPGAIEHRLRRGALLRVHQGVYAVGHGAITDRGRWMAAVLACGENAVLSHRAAGQLWRILPIAPALPEVTRPDRFKPRPGIRIHRTVLARDETDRLLEIPVTSAARTVFDLAAVLPLPRLERAFREMEVRRLTGSLSLHDLLERHPGRRGAAKLRTILAARAPSGASRNDFEGDFVVLVDAYGLPRPRINADLFLRGRFFEIDALWEEQRLAVELDGRAVHATPHSFESDRERDRILIAEGWRTMRVTWRQLRDQPAAVAADLRLALTL